MHGYVLYVYGAVYICICACLLVDERIHMKLYLNAQCVGMHAIYMELCIY